MFYSCIYTKYIPVAGLGDGGMCEIPVDVLVILSPKG